MLQSKRTIARLIAIIALALLAVPAGATVTVQNTQADWNTLTTGYFTTLVDFEGLATSSVNPTYSTADGLTLGGVKFVGDNLDSTYYLQAFDSVMGGTFNWGSGDYILGSGWGTKYIQVTLPADITALSTDVMNSNGVPQLVTVTLSTGESYTVNTFANPTRGFIGFISDTPIEWVRFSAATSFTVMDNFTYGSASTPEPNALFLAGAGLIGLWFARRLGRRCR